MVLWPGTKCLMTHVLDAASPISEIANDPSIEGYFHSGNLPSHIGGFCLNRWYSFAWQVKTTNGVLKWRYGAETFFGRILPDSNAVAACNRNGVQVTRYSYYPPAKCLYISALVLHPYKEAIIVNICISILFLIYLDRPYLPITIPKGRRKLLDERFTT